MQNSGNGRRTPWPSRRLSETRRRANTAVRRAALAAFMLACASLAAPASAGDGRYYVGLDAGFKTGDFGTSTQSDLYYLSAALGYVAPRYDVSVTVPYLALTTGTAAQSATETGVGDVIARGGRELLPAGGDVSLYGSLAVKLPTADETKGLGTGAADVGAFANLSREREGMRFSLLGGYIKIGDPPGADLDDVLLYGVGVSGTRSRTRLYGSLEGRTASVRGADDPLEVNAGFFHPLNPRRWMKGSAFVGLNDGGPGWGVSLGFGQWF